MIHNWTVATSCAPTLSGLRWSATLTCTCGWETTSTRIHPTRRAAVDEVELAAVFSGGHRAGAA